MCSSDLIPTQTKTHDDRVTRHSSRVRVLNPRSQSHTQTQQTDTTRNETLAYTLCSKASRPSPASPPPACCSRLLSGSCLLLPMLASHTTKSMTMTVMVCIDLFLAPRRKQDGLCDCHTPHEGILDSTRPRGGCYERLASSHRRTGHNMLNT